MPLLGDLSEHEIAARLQGGHLRLRVGPYTYNLTSNVSQVIAGIQTLYSDFHLAQQGEFDDFRVAMNHKSLLHRLRSKAEFLFDQQRQFGSIPTSQAYAFMEWGMNWCVSIHVNEYLKLHAGTVAKNDSAIIMPGVPGAGKSTLCAAMGLTGWRILSDEHALIPPGTAQVVPLYRPVSLKNESIAVIRSFDQNAIFGPASEDTHKGTVAHMKADHGADSHDTLPVPARIMLFPKYSKDDSQRLSPRPRTESFILAAYHSFNYSLLGEVGFQAMKTLVDSVECYDLVYHDLDWAIQTLGDLHNRVCAL
jgi:HprK-related kinase A